MPYFIQSLKKAFRSSFILQTDCGCDARPLSRSLKYFLLS